MSVVKYEQKAHRCVKLAWQTTDLKRRNQLLLDARSWLRMAVDEAIPSASSSQDSNRLVRIHGTNKLSRTADGTQ